MEWDVMRWDGIGFGEEREELVGSVGKGSGMFNIHTLKTAGNTSRERMRVALT